MKVVATAKGFYGGSERNPGDEFDVPRGSKASWFKTVKGEVDAESVREALGPTSSPDPHTAVPTHNLTGEDDHDSDDDKDEGDEDKEPPRTLSEIAKQPVKPPLEHPKSAAMAPPKPKDQAKK